MTPESRDPTRPSAARRPPPSRLRSLGVAARTLVAVAALGALAACGRPNAMGEENSLIVVADPGLWRQVEQDTYDALEPTLFTTRDEKKFNVTHVAPDGNELEQLVLWRQILVFATPGDPLLERVAAAAGRTSLSPPEFFRVPNVWATGQAVTAVALEPGREAESVRTLLPEIAAALDREYREWALSRMFVSGVDTALAAALEDSLGFTLRVPRVYQHVFRADGIVLIRNDNPDPAELIRSILVQRRPPMDSVTTFAFAAWRAGIDSVQYNVPQSFELEPGSRREIELDGATGIEVRGVWQDEAAYPAGGLFIGRALRCPDATFFVDAWLYSPNPRRSKWQFLMQLEEITDSFRCANP
jgi:hypothetical protein